MSRQMYRFLVPVDDRPHTFTLTSDPVAVAPKFADFLPDGGTQWAVEFWAEHDDDAGKTGRAFRVFGTGHPLPADARWVGTCDRAGGLVWHLYEVSPS